MNKVIQSWRYLLIVTSITTFTFFLLSYDISPEKDLYLLIILVIGIVATIILVINAICRSIYLRQLPSKKILYTFLILLASMPLNYCYRNGMFWGKKMVEAAFLDDRSRMDLTLFENGHYIISSGTPFSEETYIGKYQLNGDTIEFNKYPVVDNDFVARKIIRKKNKIYFNLLKSGEYDTTFYYFQDNFDKRR